MAPSMGVVERVNGHKSPQSPVPEPIQPTISPYATRTVAIRIGASGTNFSVPEAIINRFDGLKARLDPHNSFGLIDLSDVSEAVGHTLLHFLYTGEYETLGLESHDIEATALAEFKVGILAYCAALSCKLEALRDLAKGEIEKAAPGVSLSDLQRTIKDVGSKLPLDDDWFSTQLQHWIRARLESNETLFTKGRLLTIVGQDAVFDRAVTKAVVDMYAKLLTSFKEHETTSAKSDAQKPVNGDLAEATSPTPTAATVLPHLASVIPAQDSVASDQAANGVSTFPRVAEESFKAELSSELPPAPLPSKAVQSENATDPSTRTGVSVDHDNLQVTDDEAEVGKAKLSKKAKKAKKRKDSLGVGNVQSDKLIAT